MKCYNHCYGCNHCCNDAQPNVTSSTPIEPTPQTNARANVQSNYWKMLQRQWLLKMPTPNPTPKPTPNPTPKPTPKPTPEPVCFSFSFYFVFIFMFFQFFFSDSFSAGSNAAANIAHPIPHPIVQDPIPWHPNPDLNPLNKTSKNVKWSGLTSGQANSPRYYQRWLNKQRFNKRWFNKRWFNMTLVRLIPLGKVFVFQFLFFFKKIPLLLDPSLDSSDSPQSSTCEHRVRNWWDDYQCDVLLPTVAFQLNSNAVQLDVCGTRRPSFRGSTSLQAWAAVVVVCCCCCYLSFWPNDVAKSKTPRCRIKKHEVIDPSVLKWR